MPPPSNITRLTAIDVGTLPTSITQDLNDAGVTYDVWYFYTAAADATLKIYGDGLPEAQISVDVYQDADTGTWLDMPDLWSNINLPIYIPVIGGHTYYLNCYVNGPSITFIDGATLNLSVEETPTAPIIAGDFLTNYEVDFEGEYPVTARSGSQDYTVKRYVQVYPASFPRGENGLPHGETGQIFPSGVAVWADDTYDNIKFYNANSLALVATIALPQPVMGICRALDRLYTITVVAGVSTIRWYDNTGTLLGSQITSTPITIAGFIGINSAATIMYYVQVGTSRIRRWDLTNNVALTDLVADTAGYKCEDLMVLEDDTVLMVFFQESTSPRDVYVLNLSTAGATLHTYSFGDFWRNDSNPPRIGYALDSPLSFWIRLQPEANYGLAIHKNILIADGSTVTTRNHTNYLGGTSLSGISQGFANTFNTTFAILPAAGLTYDATIQITVNEAFANNGGAQSTFKIGKTGTPEFFVPASTFTDQPMGANFVFPVTVAAGENILVTGTTKTGAGTGRIYVGVFVDDTLGTLGSEKSGALLVVPSSPLGTIVVTKTTAEGDTTLFDFSAGGGLAPTSFSLADGDTQTFDDVAAGSGYSIAELTPAIWTSSATVSNGTLDNIVVVEGETTTVAFANTQVAYPNWLGSRVTRYPRRLIRSPFVSANGSYIRVKRLQLDMQPGMVPPPPGVPRDVMMRASRDGGNTWSSFRVQDPGDIGAYLARVDYWQVAFGRAIIIEFVDHLPNCIVQGWIDADQMGV